MGERVQIPKLKECRKCRYAACICLVLTHAKDCPWRLARLDQHPKPCAQHDQIACEPCHPCNCGKPVRWRAAA